MEESEQQEKNRFSIIICVCVSHCPTSGESL